MEKKSKIIYILYTYIHTLYIYIYVCVWFHRIVMAEWYVYACSHGHTHVCAGIHVWSHACRCSSEEPPCSLKHCFLFSWGSLRRLDCPASELQESGSCLHPQRWIKSVAFSVDSGHQTQVLVFVPQAFCWLSYLFNPHRRYYWAVMKTISHRKENAVWIPWYEVPGVVTITDTEIGWCLPGLGRRGSRELFNWERISVLQQGNSLEMGYTAMWLYLQQSCLQKVCARQQILLYMHITIF